MIENLNKFIRDCCKLILFDFSEKEREEMGVLSPWDVQKGKVYPKGEKDA